MMNHVRLALLGTLVVSAIWPAAAQPQNYPNRTITFVVPFAAGGLTDVPARILAAMMQERIGQNIVIENKPGGSGVVGGTFAVRGPTATRSLRIRSPTRRTCTTSRFPTTRSMISP